MKPALKTLWRTWAPAWLRSWRAWRRDLVFKGPFESWEKALARSQGYDDKQILKKTVLAAREVAAGRAAYDRDTITFAVHAPDLVLLPELRRVAGIGGGKLHVLDFGGSLGSSYRQNRSFIQDIPTLEWHVVEQAAVAAAGAREFTTAELHFHTNLDEALIGFTPNFLLLSSVLQYLEYPEIVLDRVTQLPIDGVVLARTPFWTGDHDLIVIQKVPPHIYRGSYPMRIFSRVRMLERWAQAGMQTTAEPAPEGSYTVANIRFTFETWFLRPALNTNKGPLNA